MAQAAPVIRIKDLKKHFLVKSSLFKRNKVYLRAVDGVSLTIQEKQSFGLVGESGCGKSTLGRLIMRLSDVSGGEVWYRDREISTLNRGEMKPYRKEMQIIFQDPYNSLNPRMSILNCVKAPLDAFKLGTRAARKERAEETLLSVGIDAGHFQKYAHELSGGQRQRVAIARAIVLEPSFIVCDEPVSALDVSIRSQVLNLMKILQSKHGLAYLFISHDLSVVQYLCDVIAVMYLGEIVEVANKEELFSSPLHPYTQALLSAILAPNPNAQGERIILRGDVPSAINPPSGCSFHPRCSYATEECVGVAPVLRQVSGNQMVRCHVSG